MKAIPSRPDYVSASEIPAPKIILKIMNSISNAYNSLIIDPFVPYFETLPTLIKPISSINDFIQMEYITIEKNFIKFSVADLYFEHQFTTDPKKNALQTYEVANLKVVLDINKYKMLTHKNLLSETVRLNQDAKFYFVTFEKRDAIFEMGDLDGNGNRIVKMKDLSQLEAYEVNGKASQASSSGEPEKENHPFFIRKIKLV